MNKGTVLFQLAAIFSIILISMTSFAQDRIFTYTYQSGVLGKGQNEIEIWNTFRTGKKEFSNRIDTRAEFETGLGGNFQTAFYLNYTSKSAQKNINGLKYLESESEYSFSNEWKYKVSDAAANSLGFALYGEYMIGTAEHELETKFIFDKKFRKLTLAFNLSGELEYEKEIEDNEPEWKITKKSDATFSAAYELNPHFHLTLESACRNRFSDKLESSALFTGAGFSYFADRFWANFTVLPQLKAFKGATDNGLDLDNYDKLEFRLIFSYEL